MDMLRGDSSIDAHALACVLYILRVGVIDQMMESSQGSFSIFLGNRFCSLTEPLFVPLQSSNASPSMKSVALRALSYTLKTLGEVPHEFREFFDDTVGAALSHFLDLSTFTNDRGELYGIGSLKNQLKGKRKYPKSSSSITHMQQQLEEGSTKTRGSCSYCTARRRACSSCTFC